MIFVAINFHNISDHSYKYPGIYPVTLRRFEQQLDVLGSSFDFVSLDDLIAHIHGQRTLPQQSCLITFDDGLREQFDNGWSILLRKGIPAAFFVNTAPMLQQTVSTVHKIHWLRAHARPDDFRQRIERICRKLEIEDDGRSEQQAQKQYRYDDRESALIKYRLNFQLKPDQRDAVLTQLFIERFGNEEPFARALYMTEDHCRQLADAGCLGTHAHAHLPLAQLDRAETHNQISASCEVLKQVTGRSPKAMSYPYGGPSAVSPAVAEVAGQCGIEIGFTMERALNRSLRNPRLLARIDTNDAPGGNHPQLRFKNDIPYSDGLPMHRTQWTDESA